MSVNVTYRAFYALLVLISAGCHFDRDLGEPAEDAATSGAMGSGTSSATAEPLGASETGVGLPSTTTSDAVDEDAGQADDAPEGDTTCRDTLACTAACVFNHSKGKNDAVDLVFSCLLECEADTQSEVLATLQLVDCAAADCYASEYCEGVEAGSGDGGGSGGSSTGGSSTGGSSTGGPGPEPDPEVACVNCLISHMSDPDNLPANSPCLEEAIACQ